MVHRIGSVCVSGIPYCATFDHIRVPRKPSTCPTTHHMLHRSLVVKILLCGPGAAHNCTHGRWQRLVHLITINFSSASYKPHLTSVSSPPVVLCGSSRRLTCTLGVLHREHSLWTTTDEEHKVVAESPNFTVGSPEGACITHRGCQSQSTTGSSRFSL